MIIKVRIHYKSKELIEFQIDEQDLKYVIGYKCIAAKRGNEFYLVNRELNKYIHRQIMGEPKDMVIDHIDGDPKNNLRSNLRIVTHKQNTQNQKKTKSSTSSKYKGVAFCKDSKRWRAYINHTGKRIDLGRHDTEELAALAYNNYASQLENCNYRLNTIT